MPRLACVDLPALPLQLLQRAHPEWARAPVAVVEADRPNALVQCANPRAAAAGVHGGQRYAAALAVAPDLHGGVISSAEVAAAVRAVTDRLRRYSPHVEPAADTPGVFWLDASGLDRLYPSLRAWAAALAADLRRNRLTPSVVVGFTRLGTYAIAKSRRAVTIVTSPEEERAALARVPLATLDLDPDAGARLHALGLETIGDFLRLPAKGLRARVGAAAERLYQLAAGTRDAPLAPVAAETIHARAIHFDAPEANVERLVFAAKRLVDALAETLGHEGRAVAALTIALALDNRTRRTERLAPASPTLDAAQLLNLVRLRLDACRLPAGVRSCQITAHVVSAAPGARDLFALYGRRDPDAAHQALARLRAELGDDAVVRAELRDGHLPASQFTWTRLDRLPAETTPRVIPPRPLVRRIFTVKGICQLKTQNFELKTSDPGTLNPWTFGPTASGDSGAAPGFSRLTSQFSLDPSFLPLGPYVVDGAWWAGGVHREYYFAYTAGGECVWIYYDRARRTIVLQGSVE